MIVILNPVFLPTGLNDFFILLSKKGINKYKINLIIEDVPINITYLFYIKYPIK